MSRWTFAFFALAVLLPTLNVQALARRGRYGGAARAAQQRMIGAAKMQLQASEALLNAASSKGAVAQAEINAALGKLQSAKHDFDEARQQIQDLAKSVRDIENEILEDQKADSAYGKSKAAMEAAKQELAELEAKLLAEGRYEERKAAAASGSEVAKLRAELLSGVEYQGAKSKADAAAKEVNRLRLDLLRADPDWKQVSDALADAHREEERAQDKANSAGVSRLAPLKDSRNAAQVAAYAQASLAQAQAQLARLGVKPQTSKGASSNASKAKK